MSATLKNIYAASPQTTRGEPIVLSADPKGKNFLYTSDKAIFIRDLENPLICDMYREHSVQTTCAAYAPSGYYIASGDISGKLRVWDTVNIEHVLKIELPVLSGAIRDISWSPDKQRIIAVGDGKETFGNVFFWDSGATVGTITGHSKMINSASYRPARPFRIVTGSIDCTSNLYTGPPFKFEKSLRDHQRFVNCVRYSPDGAKFVTVGSDKKGFIYDGKTAEKLGEFSSENPHKLGIYSVSWNADSTQFITASADKTVKLWDAETLEVVTTFNIAENPTVDDMQMGCLWMKNDLLSVSLSGDINYLDANNSSKPWRVVKGHNKNVTALSVNKNDGKIYSAGHDGKIVSWNVDEGPSPEPFVGTGHKNAVTDIEFTSDGRIVTAAMDDSIKIINPTSQEFEASISFNSAPSEVCCGKNSDLIVVGTFNTLELIRGGAVTKSIQIPYKANAIDMSNDDVEIAVAGDDNDVHLYSIEGDEITEKSVLKKHRGPVMSLQYSPDGKYIASADSQRDIFVWDRNTETVVNPSWKYHDSRISDVAWSPDSVHLATCSVDTNIYVWNVEYPKKRVFIGQAHLSGGCNAIDWIDQWTIVSGGKDCCVKSWSLEGI